MILADLFLSGGSPSHHVEGCSQIIILNQGIGHFEANRFHGMMSAIHDISHFFIGDVRNLPHFLIIISNS